MKPTKKLSANEMLEVLSQQWAEKKDVMSIGYVGDSKALSIMQEIKKSIEQDGKKVPKGLVPMKYIIEYFDIDISYLKKVSR